MKQKGTATTPKKPNAFWAWFVSFLNFFRDNKVLFIIIGLFVWFFFPQLKLWFKFKGVERVQIAKLLKPLEKRLDNLAEKAKTVEDLSDEEAGEMQSLKKAIVAAKKKVKEGPPPPPVPPPPKPAPAKPKEEVWDWTFEWEATAEQLASGRQKIVGRINDAKIISYTPKVLKFEYKR